MNFFVYCGVLPSREDCPDQDKVDQDLIPEEFIDLAEPPLCLVDY